MTFPLLVLAPLSPIDLVSPPCTPPSKKTKPSERQVATVPGASTQLDSDSEDSDCLTLVPDLPNLPSLPSLSRDLTGDRNLRPAELEALELLRRTQAPSKTNIIRLFDLVPRRLMKHCLTGRFFVTGASPRGRNITLLHSLEMPLMTLVLNRFLKSRAPHCRYTTIAVREGCVSEPHRDSRNGPLKACVLGLTGLSGAKVSHSRRHALRREHGKRLLGDRGWARNSRGTAVVVDPTDPRTGPLEPVGCRATCVGCMGPPNCNAPETVRSERAPAASHQLPR